MNSDIYLDNNATTPVDPEVMEAMLPYFTEYYGNASSINHPAGKKASEAVHKARMNIAGLIGASEKEITFTSGATEAINLALQGVFHRYKKVGKHIITCTTEHRAVLDVCRYLEKQGAEITYLRVNRQGEIDLGELERSIRKDTILLSFMAANNETGVLHPIAEIAGISQRHKVLFFCDATQAIGKIPFPVAQYGIDLIAFSGHKMYGPKGVGALYIRRKSNRTQLEALLHGGGQENGLRAGTLNVPGIVGMGTAAALCQRAMKEESQRLEALRNQLENKLLTLEQSYVNGSSAERLPHVSNMCFRFLKAEQIMVGLRKIAMAAGSACATGSLNPSHVLLAMGLEKEDAHASLRFSLGRFTTAEEIDTAAQLIMQKVTELRNESPVWALYKQGIIS